MFHVKQNPLLSLARGVCEIVLNVLASAEVYIVLFAVAQALYGVVGYRKAVILAEFAYITVDYLVAGDGGRRFVYGGVVLKVLIIVGHVVQIGVLLQYGGVADGVFENVANIVFVLS